MRPNPSTALAEVVIDELVRNGVDLFVVSPGSRSAALTIAASQHPRARTVVVIDERSAAFWALGRSKAGGGAAVIGTSGTAVANWFPAVVEADSSLTPLILLSADRPAELRGVGANQTIEQAGLFGDKTRLALDIPAPEGDDQNGWWRELVCRAVAASRGSDGRPGPVQLNVAFREPTVPVPDDGRTRTDPYPHSTEGRPDGRPWVDQPIPDTNAPMADLPPIGRGLVIAGDGRYDRPGLLEEARRLGWPLLATASSGLRGNEVIDVYHHILAGPLSDELVPETVVAIGAVGPSERLEDLVARARHRVRVDSWGRHIDPRRNATHRLVVDPVAFLSTMEAAPEPGWAEGWRGAQERVRKAVSGAVEWGTGAAVVGALEETGMACLVAASSLPIREVDAHLRGPVRVVANRGASGIDGIVSTALGVSTVTPGTVLLTGDLSLYHDANGFLSEDGVGLVTVVIDNGGGGLFDSLPTAAHAPSFERLFVTPPRRKAADLARLHGLEHHVAGSGEQLREIVDRGLTGGSRMLVEVPVDRVADLAARRRLDEVARSALEA